MELKEGGVIRLCNNKACEIQGMGTIHLKMFDDRDFLLKDVRYIPELKRNLISISMFDGLGYCTRIERGMMRISHGALVTGHLLARLIFTITCSEFLPSSSSPTLASFLLGPIQLSGIRPNRRVLN